MINSKNWCYNSVMLINDNIYSEGGDILDEDMEEFKRILDLNEHAHFYRICKLQSGHDRQTHPCVYVKF